MPTPHPSNSECQFTNHYAVLGIHRTANLQDIKNAFRRRSKQVHPDKSVHKNAAHERFIALKTAYDILSNADEKCDYDIIFDSLQDRQQDNGRLYDELGYFGHASTICIHIFESSQQLAQLPYTIAIELPNTDAISFLMEGCLLPISKTEILSTTYSQPNMCEVAIWSQEAKMRKLIGRFNFQQLPLVMGGLAWVELKVSADSNGLLNIAYRAMSGA